MQSAEPIIPLFTFSTNPNNFYTSTNDTTTMFVSNVQIGIVLCLEITSLLLIGNLLIFMPLFGKLSVKISSILKLFLCFHASLLSLSLLAYMQKVSQFFWRFKNILVLNLTNDNKFSPVPFLFSTIY